jgi:nitronate monooxygenase
MLRDRLSLPLIAAPMLRVSGPDLVSAACNAGVIGAFPTANARSVDELDDWLQRTKRLVASHAAPFCANLIIRQPRMAEDLDCLTRHKVELVITSVGSPAAVVGPLHDVGCLVLADVATLEHAEKALEAGVDGLVLLTAGAGGQTGWLNPFAFVRAVRQLYDGILVLAGGVSDGWALWATQCLGCDLAYMGTRLIATHESLASPAYKSMLVESDLDDVLLTKAFTGLQTNMLRPSIVAAGLDPNRLDETVSRGDARKKFGEVSTGTRRWTDIWSAGHSVSGVRSVLSVSDLVACTHAEFEMARQASIASCAGHAARSSAAELS